VVECTGLENESHRLRQIIIPHLSESVGFNRQNAHPASLSEIYFKRIPSESIA